MGMQTLLNGHLQRSYPACGYNNLCNPMYYGTMKLCEVLLTALVLCALIYTALCVVCWAVKLNVFVPPSPAHCCLSPMSPVTPPPTLSSDILYWNLQPRELLQS